MRQTTVTITIDLPARQRLAMRTFLGHRPHVDLYLFAKAVTDRLGITDSRCPYCGENGACRWPWQSLSSHIAVCGK